MIRRVASDRSLWIGLDVGSTTIKAVVVDAGEGRVLWRDYQRHQARQAERTLELLRRIELDLEQPPSAFRLFVTGSGGSPLAPQLGGKFVHEVAAVSLAVEKLHPECRSVIELGGQDAKIIVFQEVERDGRMRKLPSMNDKCAGGTGAVIDKIGAKLGIRADALGEQRYEGLRLHPVAGRCGIFAETDVNGLQKQGVPRDELMASLFQAIVQQNLTVLTRGKTLRPVVLLLGGPNAFVCGMVEAWRANIPPLWEERGLELPDRPLEELVALPEHAEYFGAIGAIEYGRGEDAAIGLYAGTDELARGIEADRESARSRLGIPALVSSATERDEFLTRYARPRWTPPRLANGRVVGAFLGIDGGSTSTKAVLIGSDAALLAKSYRLSGGNPIEDVIDVVGELRRDLDSRGVQAEVLGTGTTGYAKDLLRDVLRADVALVETVAHAKSALHYYGEVDVICDVGGQDIKVVILKDGRVKDFRVNTQCSAGNGYFLQSTCESFGHPVERYAELAFSARSMPEFGYGCAVFLQSDVVDFQRRGFDQGEILAGLAAVLPKNVWLYVCQMPNLAHLGRRFVLQGGTQNNLAAVRAQVEFIEEHFDSDGVRPEIAVHRFAGESGAIGAALEARELYERGRRTDFIGLESVESIEYHTTHDERTRCVFCSNRCTRTFIDVRSDAGTADPGAAPMSGSPRAVPLEADATRIVVATCDKGAVELVDDFRAVKKDLDAARAANPDLAAAAARAAFRSYAPASVASTGPRLVLTAAARERVRARKRRTSLRIGIPRVLAMYSLGPLFSAYFESLGVSPTNVVWSEPTSESLYKQGSNRGAIDPCFPSKVALAHLHDLLHGRAAEERVDVIFFPMIDNLPSRLAGCTDQRACSALSATPEAVKAAFTSEQDLFAAAGVRFVSRVLHPADPLLLEREMIRVWGSILGLDADENRRAIRAGYAALESFDAELRRSGRAVLDRLEAEGRLGIVLLGRPYHADPGMNHGIPGEFQVRGYPILTVGSLPLDEDVLERLFAEDLRTGRIDHPLEIRDVWKNSFSANTNDKLFAAKYVARHPNLVALELSSFKCGHDAPICTVVERIVESSGTPYFSFRDLDENRPSGSIKLRVETIAHFLQSYSEQRSTGTLYPNPTRRRSGFGTRAAPAQGAPT